MNKNIKWFGRNSYKDDKCFLYHTGSGFIVKFKGTKIIINAKVSCFDNMHCPYVKVIIDENDNIISFKKENNIIEYILPYGIHYFEFRKKTEALDSFIIIEDIKIEGEILPIEINNAFKIEVIGDSSCTGFADLGKLGEEKSTYNCDGLISPMYLAAQEMNAEINIFAASGWGVRFSRWTDPYDKNIFDSYPYITFNSLEKWNYNQYIPDLIIISLGTNDGSYIDWTTNEEEKKNRSKQYINQYLKMIKYLHNIYKEAKILMIYGTMGEVSTYKYTLEIYEKAKSIISTIEIIYLEGDRMAPCFHPTAQSLYSMKDRLIEKIESMLKLI